jgi:hypothetical protein
VHTEFSIQVSDGESASVVTRRYSEFDDLHSRLQSMMEGLPAMPPKGVLKKLSASFMRNRQHELDVFLAAALASDPLFRNRDLREFLGFPAVVISDLSDIRVPLKSSPGERPIWLPSSWDMLEANKTAASMRPSWLDDAYAEMLTNCSTASTERCMLDEVPLVFACEALATRPDFTGCWILARAEGSMEFLMKELEISWVLRRAAAALGYGVGKVRMTIIQTGNRLEITNHNPVKTFRRTLIADGMQHDEVVAGKHIQTLSYWEAGVLVVYSENLKTLKKFPKCVRYLDGQDMIAEYVFPDGQTVKQYFSQSDQRATI